MNGITLTQLLLDLRSRGYIHCSTETVASNFESRGYSVTTEDIKEMMSSLERLSYVKKAQTESGFRMVNPTQSISFTGCVWCGTTATPNYEERKLVFGTKLLIPETKLVATNTDRVCKSCSVSEEFVEEEGDLYGE
jgi:hypothetical protein